MTLAWDPAILDALRAPRDVMAHVHHCPCCYEAWVCDDTCTVWTDLDDTLVDLAVTVRPPLKPAAARLALPTASHFVCEPCRKAGAEAP